MSEEKKDVTTAEVQDKTFTQEQLNKLVGEARTKERKKLNDVKSELAELKTQLQELTQYKEQASPQLEKLKTLEKNEETRQMQKKVANEMGVDRSIVETLAGKTEEELKANVEKIKKQLAPKEFYKNAHIEKKTNSTFEDKLTKFLEGD
jgi:hypothetical protein